MEAASTRTKVFVVPVTAISSRSDGTTVVTVLRNSTAREPVEVKVGATGGGYVQVSPEGGTLRAGTV
ncbi:hypothetical protein AB0K74_31605 [Streptomyces sp. NPDC056159]|uniref:hypothetical protein n=1 Tax=Streptomyces sp. NPDC056159 TaxID=3155537 RepID=UPI00343DBE0E